MRGGILVLWLACALVAVLIVALAQSDVNPAGDPAASDESQAASVVTPTSDAQINAAGQPIAPRPPGQTQPETQPDSEAVTEEAVTADQTIVPEDNAQALAPYSARFSGSRIRRQHFWHEYGSCCGSHLDPFSRIGSSAGGLSRRKRRTI